MGDNRGLCDLFEDSTEFGYESYDDWGAGGAASPDNLLSILRALEDGVDIDAPLTPLEEAVFSPRGGGSSSSTVGAVVGVVGNVPEAEGDSAASGPRKRMKTAEGAGAAAAAEGVAAAASNLLDGQHRMSHITVERNRRKQMNEHLSVLRSLMPCFYVKRGDQASIIGGVVEYIKELQQILRSLEAKKQRKAYSEVLSPRPVPSPRPPPLSPRRPPPPTCSPRIINLPVSPGTPQPAGSPYKLRVLQQQQQPAAYLSPAAVPSSLDPSYAPDGASDLAANSKSPVADVEVKFSGPNVLLKTISPRIPGQAVKIIAALERLPLEILHLHVNTVHDTVLKSFTIKIGIECGLSAEELADEVQQTFSC